jgi:hypothetical protein
MTLSSVGYVVDLAKALAWARESLDRGNGDFGSELCDMLSTRLGTFSSARLLVSPGWSFLVDDLSPIGHNIKGSLDVATLSLSALWRQGARTLIVESDVWSRNDTDADPGVAFAGERVERWIDLRNGPEAASLLQTASWPLNAFVSTMTSGELGIRAGEGISVESLELIADSTVALINQVFDDEAYLILVRDF